MKPSLAILGGDLRQVWLAKLVREDGFPVVTWGLDQGGAPENVPLDQALEQDVLILPMPVCKNGRLFLPLTDTELDGDRLWPKVRFNQLMLGGLIGDLGQRLMADYGLTLIDYYAREETQVANAVPTAEAVGHRAESFAAQGIHFSISRRIQGIKLLLASIRITRSHIQTIPPQSRSSAALSNDEA